MDAAVGGSPPTAASRRYPGGVAESPDQLPNYPVGKRAAFSLLASFGPNLLLQGDDGDQFFAQAVTLPQGGGHMSSAEVGVQLEVAQSFAAGYLILNRADGARMFATR